MGNAMRVVIRVGKDGHDVAMRTYRWQTFIQCFTFLPSKESIATGHFYQTPRFVQMRCIDASLKNNSSNQEEKKPYFHDARKRHEKSVIAVINHPQYALPPGNSAGTPSLMQNAKISPLLVSFCSSCR
jgi:hypothetical protein